MNIAFALIIGIKRRMLKRTNVVAVLASGLVLSVSVTAQAINAGMTAQITPANSDSVFQVYADNRVQGISNYITIDLPLVAYSLLRQKSIEVAEATVVTPAFDKFLQGLDQALSGQRATNTRLEQTIESDALKANRQFIWLLQSLLYGKPSSDLSESLVDEYQRIIAADSVQESALWGRMVDYTQYMPRGRYTQSMRSEQYFRAMRYASSHFFAIKPSAASGVSVSECERQLVQLQQLVHLIHADISLQTLRNELDEALFWQFGPADDLTDSDVITALSGNRNAHQSEHAGKRLLSYARDNNRQPKIIDAIVDATLLESGSSIEDVVTGWRLLPSRFSVETGFQQAMLAGKTGAYSGNSDSLPFGYGIVAGEAVKSYPTALEWIALLGSDNAFTSLVTSQETAFKGYVAEFEKQRNQLHQLAGAELLQAQIVRAALIDNETSTQKQFNENRLLAFNAWHKFNNVLYAKQSNTLIAKGLVRARARQGVADLETRTALYLTLGFAAREQLKHSGLAAWREYSRLMDKLAELSMKRENEALLSEADLDFLNSLDTRLLTLTGKSDQPVIVDVHTNINEALVVQQGTEYPNMVSHYSDETLLRRGSMMRFVEFKQPMNERLTLSQWHRKLARE